MRSGRVVLVAALLLAALAAGPGRAQSPRTVKPVLHGRHWVAITGKPLAATAGAMIFAKGGNAVDAAAAMLAATCTMWDTLGWGGETQALVFNPRTKKVIGLNALGVAPDRGDARSSSSRRACAIRPTSARWRRSRPARPAGSSRCSSEWGRLCLADVLEPAIQMADGYAIEASSRTPSSDRSSGSPSGRTRRPSSSPTPARRARRRRPARSSCRRTSPRRCASWSRPRSRRSRRARAGKRRCRPRTTASTRATSADELVRAHARAGRAHHEGGPRALAGRSSRSRSRTSYKGIDVYKLTVWTQGPAMLQALNILENVDLKAMGYNSPRYIHTVYQAMSMAFADRDFYYGDPSFPPEEPVAGLLSKEYARQRLAGMRARPQRPRRAAGRPVSVPGRQQPLQGAARRVAHAARKGHGPSRRKTAPASARGPTRPSEIGTTSVIAADAEGWVVSMTPSGAWVPAVVAGRTGIGLSQRMQAFVLEAADNPYNVVVPGKQPRVTLTPTLTLVDGLPQLAFGRPGRRHAGPEPAAVLPERRRVRDERAAGDRGRRTSTASSFAAPSARTSRGRAT